MLPSFIRTLVPFTVAYFFGFPVVRTLGLTEEHVTSLVTVLLGGLYYLLARLAETKIPQLGWLLGHPSQPTYETVKEAA
jgi:hypothetical protein